MSRGRKDAATRLLLRLAKTGARIAADAGGSVLLDGAGGRTLVSQQDVDRITGRGLAEWRDGVLVISAAGRALLRRQLAETDPYEAQHQDRESVVVVDEKGAHVPVVRNRAESPLAWLRGRRGADGKPLVDAAEFEAGERLRSDFTRGQMMPRITTNWSALARGAGARQQGGGDITDAALAARMRVERALEAVGPELTGVLLDVCCFLKRMEEVEQQRGWPARSGKVVLRLALAVLARHYGLGVTATGPGKAGTLHWGAPDYRPRA